MCNSLHERMHDTMQSIMQLHSMQIYAFCFVCMHVMNECLLHVWMYGFANESITYITLVQKIIIMNRCYDDV